MVVIYATTITGPKIALVKEIKTLNQGITMRNLAVLEACYKKFTQDMPSWLPEDIVEVNLDLLQKLDLLHYHDPAHNDPSLTRYFHVIESDDKITLINDDFVVWIVPEKMHGVALTYTLIALNTLKEPELQMCFVTSGVYNNSRLVLRVLEKYLFEIEENEAMLRSLKEKTG